MNRKSFWANALESQMEAFFAGSNIKPGMDYIIMRADMIPKEYDPYLAYNELSHPILLSPIPNCHFGINYLKSSSLFFV